ncbi:DUF5777 family beta-barrel protein [Spongiivirga citrea]|uniref:DUF5777 domain-containing protein n=1 Tax=Spongiivirga citrea TaxID=1481457 RepID=A0A6M0CMI8_9FLAO|nr:DUF5777 family beta-barrel protein [Spongiivirga citrea]NER18872.1 hypothetical protein [Spongiivirga citrea]
MKARKILLFLFLGMLSSYLKAQDLLDILDQEQPDSPLYANATFSFSRITFGQSVETRKTGTLDIFTSSRFWNTPAPRSQSFVADRMSSRIALEYGLSDRLLFGVGGTTFDGRFDGFLKFRLVKQRTDGNGSSVSISLFQNAGYFSERFAGVNVDRSTRLSYTSQLIIAKKFSPNFSLQITPTFVHRGLLYDDEDSQNHIAVGVGGRYKLGGHVSLVSEYYYVANPIKSQTTFGAFALGINWELSDVMLQWMLTNARSTVEDAFILETRNNFNFKNPNFHFGFNFTYTFHLKNRLKK